MDCEKCSEHSGMKVHMETLVRDVSEIKTDVKALCATNSWKAIGRSLAFGVGVGVPVAGVAFKALF